MNEYYRLNGLATPLPGDSRHEAFIILANKSVHRIANQQLDIQILLEKLCQPCSFEEIIVIQKNAMGGRLSKVKKPTVQTIEALVDAGLIDRINRSTGNRKGHFSPVRSFLEASSSVAGGTFDHIRRCNVAIIGAGVLGAPVACHLAQCGIGRLYIVDGDTVCSHNLARQLIYEIGDLYKSKVSALLNRIYRLSGNSRCKAVEQMLLSETDVQQVLDQFESLNLVVITGDEPPILLAVWITRYCIERGIPVIRANSLHIGSVYVPGSVEPCPCCQTVPKLDKTILCITNSNLVRAARARNSIGTSMHPAAAAACLSQRAFEFLVSQSHSSRNTTGVRSKRPIREGLKLESACPACLRVS